MASCFVPVFSGLIPPRYRGSRVIGKKQNKLKTIELRFLVASSSYLFCISACLLDIYPYFISYTYLDGGYSNNLPKLDKDTITVSPFSGCADICPQTNDLENSLCVNLMPNTRVQLNKENFRRMFHVLLPPPPELVARYAPSSGRGGCIIVQNHADTASRDLTILSGFFSHVT
jgi:hypothetical protein